MSLEIQTERIRIVNDQRGQLIKAWPRPIHGEAYVVELTPGHPRGHHLHHRGGEWFIPLSGESILVVEDPVSRERAVIPLQGVRARVEPGLAHALFAAGDRPALVMAVADLEHTHEETSPFTVAPP